MNPAIVIVAYNRPHSLERLLSSISRASFPHRTSLIISIDKSDNSEVYEIAESYRWNHGSKKLVFHENHLGLRKHIIRCADLTYEYGNLILLEDDLFVSPVFYQYASEALEFYKNDRDISGISLYSHRYNETAQMSFRPLYDESDVFFMQLPSSWGECWTYDQWNEFKIWYDKNGTKEIGVTDNLPWDVIKWPQSSWKKYFIKYMVDNNKFFAYPRGSLTTNFANSGIHHNMHRKHLQVPLEFFEKKYKFKKKNDSLLVYDSFCEILPEKLKKLAPELANYDFDVNLYGQKKTNNLKKEYVLSIHENKKSILTFGKTLKPVELNIIFKTTGKSITLTANQDCFPSIKVPSKKDIIYYYNIPEYFIANATFLKGRHWLNVCFWKVLSIITQIVKVYQFTASMIKILFRKISKVVNYFSV